MSQVLYLKATDRESLIAALEAAGMGQIIDVFEYVEPVREVVSTRLITPEEMNKYEDVPLDDGADSYTYQDGMLTMYRTVTPGQQVKTGEQWMFKPVHQGDAFDEIGLIYSPTGKTIETAMGPQPEQAPIPGWHANLMLHGDVPEALQAISIPEPSNPRRIFGGWKSAAEIAAEEAAREQHP